MVIYDYLIMSSWCINSFHISTRGLGTETIHRFLAAFSVRSFSSASALEHILWGITIWCPNMDMNGYDKSLFWDSHLWSFHIQLLIQMVGVYPT